MRFFAAIFQFPSVDASDIDFNVDKNNHIKKSGHLFYIKLNLDIRIKYEESMNDYLIGIGKRIKDIRKKNKKTISNVASVANVSNGLISRIENGRTIPSLPVLFSIINALEIEVCSFFEGMSISSRLNYVVSRSEENAIIEKEDNAKGFEYKYIFGKQLSSIGFEAVLLEVQPDSQRDKVETDAYEFKFILSGECVYIIGDEEVLLKEGDSIFFDGRIPHVPVNKGIISAKMLVFYFFLNTQKE